MSYLDFSSIYTSKAQLPSVPKSQSTDKQPVNKTLYFYTYTNFAAIEAARNAAQLKCKLDHDVEQFMELKNHVISQLTAAANPFFNKIQVKR